MSDFTNKTVLVTGGSRGIGRACAQLFAKQNANVIITYRSNHSEADKTLSLLKASGKHHTYQLNIADASSVQQFFQAIEKVSFHLMYW
jgi:NAD(P)-dependent dehydrogenase (short-subunit alcohol dehydrogenase family)